LGGYRKTCHLPPRQRDDRLKRRDKLKIIFKDAPLRNSLDQTKDIDVDPDLLKRSVLLAPRRGSPVGGGIGACGRARAVRGDSGLIELPRYGAPIGRTVRTQKLRDNLPSENRRGVKSREPP
jgi:hypothetical protein